MTEDEKRELLIYIEVLRERMKEMGAIFAFAIDPEDNNRSRLAITNRDKYMKSGKLDGFSVGLPELNRGLL